VPQRGLDLLEKLGIDDRLMFALVQFRLVLDLADVQRVGEQGVEGALLEGPASLDVAPPGLPDFVLPAAAGQLLDHRQQ